MSFKLNIFYILVLLFFPFCLPTYSQQILDEMQLIDISQEQAIRSTVIRDPQQALLIVKTQISQLRILSNNIINKSEQVEPGTWHVRLAPGTHRLSFQADGFISVQQRFYFNPKDVKGIRIRVIPAAEKKEEKNVGVIVIQSTPDSAAVYLNQQFYGVTPYLGKTLAGQYKLELRKEPYVPHEETIIIISGETHPVNVELGTSLGTVHVVSNPEKARVAIDERFIGETPLQFGKIGKGLHTLTITLENYEKFETEFEISSENRTKTYNVPLILLESSLNIEGTPRGAQINIDGKAFGLIPIEKAKINFGRHDIAVKKQGFFDYEQNILINKAGSYNINIQLEPKSKYSALLYSTFLPGSGQVYAGRKTQGIIVGLAALGSAATSFIFNNSYLDKRDKYIADKNAYDINTDLGKMESLYNTMQDGYSTMEDAESKSKIMFGIMAAVWLYNVLDAMLFFPDQTGFNLRAETNDLSTQLILSIKL
jgi:hypothetical protein